MIVENYTTGTGQNLKVHDLAVCSAVMRNRGNCVIHARLDTHMKDWPTRWRTSWGGFMEVLCPHGIGHPAPEETRKGGSGHGCDGCCVDPAKASQPEPEPDVLRYSRGGLMRCCIKTLTEMSTEGNAYTEGEKVGCRWCNTRMVLDRGVWQWDKTRSWYVADAELA